MVESTLHKPSLYILIMATTTTEAEAYSNPVRLSVTTRESNADAGPSTSTLSERERLLKARKSNEVVRRKGEKWADNLMEETVDRDTFKRAVSLSTPPRGEGCGRRNKREGLMIHWTGLTRINNHIPFSCPPYD
jgi:hypothetical protein